MLSQEFIRKKKEKNPLSKKEIEEFFMGYLNGKIADYQVSAMLMACYLQGMNIEETKALTELSSNSGKIFSWPNFPKNLIVDKHSTGGVGDKTSLIILPLCLLEGLKIPMISGRGLGHTGGTIDKLESIPNIKLDLSFEESENLLKNFGAFITSQTEEIAPLDKKLYALRDVTSTVSSIPLIVASILGKKLAEGIGCLVLDVKYGSGAFMQKKEEAEKLAENLLLVGRDCGLSMKVLLTSMNSPLGRVAGNALEVVECINILKGLGESDTRDLSVELAAHMVKLAHPNKNFDNIKEKLNSHLDSGRAYEKFAEFISMQGGKIDRLAQETKAKIIKPVFARSKGYIQSCNVHDIGQSIVKLGGGRQKYNDRLDYTVGLSSLKHVGDFIELDEPLAMIHANSEQSYEEAKKCIIHSYLLSQDKGDASKEQLILKTI